MLTIYRRHSEDCPHAKDGRRYRRCKCPLWCDGTLSGRLVRKSLGLRDWQRAQDRIREWEAEGRIAEDQRIQLVEAWRKFLADAEGRSLQTATIAKYKFLRRQMEEFASQRALVFLTEFDLDTLSDFRSKISRANLSRLRAFFRFAFERQWISGNPAHGLKPPKVRLQPTMPFSVKEMQSILDAVEVYGQHAGRVNAQRLRAFILLLRYSGMRIGDAVRLTPDRIGDGRLFLYTQKTGQAVNVLLPQFVLRELDSCPRGANGHFFWSGRSTLKTAVSMWQRTLKSLFGKTAILGGHAHRFRDTFAVEFLLASGTLEQLSVLLGHSSTRITERHYSPWIRSRQQQLEALLERAWAADPLALAETNRTKSVQRRIHIN